MEWLQTYYELSVSETVLVAATAFIAGVMRGFSGFGAALAIAPVLASTVGPRAAIPAILLLMLITSVQLGPRAVREVNWPVVIPLSIGGIIGIIIGGWLLIIINQEFVQKSISIIVIFFSVVMLTGWRYRGQIGPAITGIAGWLGGFISGVAAAGGPAVIIFLLAGPDSAARNRAAIILYFIFAQIIGLVVYWFGGLMTAKTFWIAFPMVPTIVLGTWIGERMFGKASENLYRRIALMFLLAIGLTTLFL
ncbi:MAG: hypothetical protein CFH41_01876 [Alphaproteobacteria bacterium MarineAlpha11_Bin1]|nr:MAG: hypothetical protein CFH41_01876 [Alphaproteobacteria bacterium MarineAlpha11_Bin1]